MARHPTRTPPAPNLVVQSSRNTAQLSRRDILRASGLVVLAAACRGRLPEGRVADVAPQPATGPTSYRGAQVYRGGAFAPATVVVDGDRIDEVMDQEGGDAEVYDAIGLWLIPGFIDAHVHLQFSPAYPILAGGVTTVRDLGSPPGVAESAEGDSLLRVRKAGRILTPLGGYPSQSWGAGGTSREVADAADAEKAVAEQVAVGASVVKVALEPAGGPLFEADVLAALVAAAHEAQLPVTAHVGSAEALALTIEHGVDELAHLPLYDVQPQEMVEVAEAGMVLVPTLATRGGGDEALRALGAFVSAGGTVVYGTDLGNAGTAPGIDQTELRAMLGAGMSPVAVLDAATSVAADHLGLPRVGRITAGSAADLVGLRTNPLEDAAAYDEVALVVAGGVRL